MNSYDILFSMEYIDKDLAEKAADYRRNNLTHLRTVAAACLILIFGVTAVFAGISANKRAELPTVIPETEIKTDLSKLPGVYAVSNVSDAVKQVGYVEAMRELDCYYVKKLMSLEYYTLVYGTAKNIKTYKTYSQGFTWYITIFDIEIIEAVRNAPDSGTIKVCAVTFDSDTRSSYFKATVDFDIINNPTAFFVLNNNKTPEHTSWNEADVRTIGETDIQTFDCADYYLSKQCEICEDIVRFYTACLTLDDLENFSVSGVPEEKEFNTISEKNSKRMKEIKRSNVQYQPPYSPDDTIMREFENGNFSLKVVLNDADEDFDYSKIRVRVYNAVKSFSDSGGGIGYDNHYCYSVSLNKDGTAVFDRPSDFFTVDIDEYTLPEDYIMCGGKFFYEPYQNSGTLIFEKIN